MDLTFRSRVAHGIFATWPPESIDGLFCEGSDLVVEFRDPWYAYEKPIMPFGLDRESLWRATYVRKHGEWSLKRIRHLDYEGGTDSPRTRR